VRLAWSNLARQELEGLRRFSVKRWGYAVAGGYLSDVRDAARRLAADPLLARPLKGSFRILRVRSHYLIVGVDAVADRRTIARVLHVAMDIERYLA
jgi:plasmid stabilization system protein ParE